MSTPEHLGAAKLPTMERTVDAEGNRVLVILDKKCKINPNPPTGTIAERYIPKMEQEFADICLDKPTLLAWRGLIESFELGEPIRAEGPTGVAKTTIAKLHCAATERPLNRINFGKDTRIGDVLGRYAPTSTALREQFEMLNEPGALKKDESIAIKAREESEGRPLRISEWMQIARLEGYTDPRWFSRSEYGWHNGPLTGAMLYGGIALFDEANLSAILERFNSVLERDPSLTLVEHLGEVIRKYVPEEVQLVQQGGELPGIKPLHPSFGVYIAQNPVGYAERVEESPAWRDRAVTKPVDAIGLQEYRDLLKFYFHGKQPDVELDGVIYYGAENVQTRFRALEKECLAKGINIDVISEWISKLHTDLAELAEKEKIGINKRMTGGNYIYTRRLILSFMDHLLNAKVIDRPYRMKQRAENVKNGTKIPEIRYTDNFHDRFVNALEHAYKDTLNSDDKPIFDRLVEASGILDYAGPSNNHPKSPDWVKKAQKKGINVTQTGDEFEVSKLDLNTLQLTVAQLQEQDFETADLGEMVKVKGAAVDWIRKAGKNSIKLDADKTDWKLSPEDFSKVGFSAEQLEEQGYIVERTDSEIRITRKIRTDIWQMVHEIKGITEAPEEKLEEKRDARSLSG